MIKYDKMSLELLSRLRMGEIDEKTENILKSRLIQKTQLTIQLTLCRFFAENVPAKRHNDILLKQLPGRLISILSKDEVW